MSLNCTLVTVSCLRDMALLDLQSQSIKNFLPKTVKVIIIINEDGTNIDKWKEEFSLFSQNYENHNLIVYEKKDFDIEWEINESMEVVKGWTRQQVLKFVISEKIYTDCYLILDSQNFLIKPLDFENLIVEGKIPFKVSEMTWARSAYENYCEILGVVPRQEKNTLSISTPIYVSTELVKNLITTIGNSKVFSEWFYSYGSLKSEFALYLAWLEKNGGIEKNHYEVHNFSHPYLRDSTDFNHQYWIFLKLLGRDPRHYWSMINHRAWGEMREDQYQRICESLNRFDLRPNFDRFRREYLN